MGAMIRQEIRTFILPKQLPIFLSLLNSLGYREIIYSPLSFTQTIYFDHPNYSLPFDISLKLRRYINKPEKIVNIEPCGKYIFEEKRTIYKKGVLLKTKKREKITGSEALDKFSSYSLAQILKDYMNTNERISSLFSNIFFTAHTATQYKRRHFYLGDSLRVTLDSNLEFFFFDNSASAYKIAEGKFIIIEIKLFNLSQEKELKKLLRQLETLGAFPSISKNCFCSNRVADRLQKTLPLEYQLYNESPNNEFELKFVIENISSGVIFLLLRYLFENHPKKFIICPEHPYTKKIGTIQRYYQQRNNIYKIAFAGDVFTKSSKKEQRENSEILVRSEVKNKPHKIISGKEFKTKNRGLIGEFHRIRKSFWVVNPLSGRTYKIAVDNSYTDSDLLSQVEIEYSGIRKGTPSLNPYPKIKEDMKYLQRFLLSFDLLQPYLKPTRLTKFNWLLSLKK